MNKQVKLNILVTFKDMYDFLLFHTYYSFSGIFGIILSIGALILLFISFNQNDMFKNVLLLILSLLFTVIQPLQLFFKAKQQVSKNAMFQEPLHYEIDSNKILVSQADQQLTIEWKEVRKIVQTKRSIIIYITTIRAYIFPKEQCGKQLDDFKEVLKNCVERNIYRIK